MKTRIYVKRIMSAMLYISALCLALSGCADIPEASAPPEAPQETLNIFGEVSAHGDIEIDSGALAELTPKVYAFSEPPTILIYHTHATEAFLQDENYTYVESKEWRTEDNGKNIVYAGEVLKSELELRGYIVIHDTTNVEPPELESAYSRSLDVMKKYEGVDIYLDLHRNAAEIGAAGNTVAIDGRECAKMFFVVGTGIGTYEGEYDIEPDWRANYTFALSIQQKVSDIAPGMMKPIRPKVGRYNQHMGMCLLLEIGNNANTMEEVLSALPFFVQAFSETVTFGGRD